MRGGAELAAAKFATTLGTVDRYGERASPGRRVRSLPSQVSPTRRQRRWPAGARPPDAVGRGAGPGRQRVGAAGPRGQDRRGVERVEGSQERQTEVEPHQKG